MRRFASVFTRNKDKEAPKADLKRSHTVLTPIPTTPVLSFGSEPASSTSSNGSASIQTPEPEEEPDLLSRTPTKKWSTWLGKKGTIKRARPPIPDDVPQWRPPQLQPPPAPKSQPPPPPRIVTDLDSDEDASDSEHEDEDDPAPMPNLEKAKTYIQNSLTPPVWASSPFACPVNSLLYPRSSNSPQLLLPTSSMQTIMHKRLLLRRLGDTDTGQSTPSNLLLPFTSHPRPTLLDSSPSLPWYHIRAHSATLNITPTSPGLRRWMSRPCFEERFVVWVPVDGGFASCPVQGSSAAVAELEFSPSVEAMIGFTGQEELSTVAPAISNNVVAPSPLRNSALKSASPVDPTPNPNPDPPVLAPTTSRVRFAEDDKDDVIPLGYALRSKKRREEKAKFLREEQERRAFELEKARHEEERRRRESERRQWEEEKRAWEKEKKAIEDERRQRIYAEEVIAARARREHQRAGGSYGVGNSLLASSSTASLRDDRHKSDSTFHSRPLHDRRRQASEPAVPQHGSTSSSPHTSSPSSSRPPSLHQAGSFGRNSSRPASVHSSSEESKPQHNANAAKRSSMASLPSRNPPSDRSSMYSLWSTSNPSLMPPVPPMPMYALDMPLLPPTPPFMLHQYPRPRSQESRDSSPGRSSLSGSPSRQHLPSNNSSSDRVNLQPPQSSSRRASNSSSTSRRPDMAHQRRSSDDAKHANLAPHKDPYGSLRSHSSTSLARGRAARPPSSFQPPPAAMPWTAPPLMTSYSQQQLNPVVVAQWTLPASKRRQTTIT